MIVSHRDRVALLVDLFRRSGGAHPLLAKPNAEILHLEKLLPRDFASDEKKALSEILATLDFSKRAKQVLLDDADAYLRGRLQDLDQLASILAQPPPSPSLEPFKTDKAHDRKPYAPRRLFKGQGPGITIEIPQATALQRLRLGQSLLMPQYLWTSGTIFTPQALQDLVTAISIVFAERVRELYTAQKLLLATVALCISFAFTSSDLAFMGISVPRGALFGAWFLHYLHCMEKRAHAFAHLLLTVNKLVSPLGATFRGRTSFFGVGPVLFVYCEKGDRFIDYQDFLHYIYIPTTSNLPFLANG